eukprot:287606-Pleurochrysis_carterae.AAC.1
MALLRKGPGRMEQQREKQEWAKAARLAARKEQTNSMEEAIQWWLQIFPLWDALPNEYIIKHPRV